MEKNTIWIELKFGNGYRTMAYIVKLGEDEFRNKDIKVLVNKGITKVVAKCPEANDMSFIDYTYLGSDIKIIE